MRMLSIAGAVLVIVGAMGSVIAAQESCSQESMLGPRLLDGTAGVEVCASPDADTLRSIESGEERLVLVLSEYLPPTSGSQALSVTALGGREQILGVFPVEAFSREDAESHRRFLLARPPMESSLEPSEPICVSVRFVSSDGSGLARLQLDIWTPGG